MNLLTPALLKLGVERVVTFDAETFWSSDYTLSKMDARSYVRDSRFKMHGFSIASSDRAGISWASTLIEQDALLRGHDWSETAILATNCVTGDHEVRTPRGWVRFDQLRDDDDVMQWDTTTQALTFARPAAVVRKPYTGPMLRWDSLYHKGIYTPDHRFVMGTSDKRLPWRFETAREFAARHPNNVHIPSAGIYESPEPLELSPLEGRLMEAIRADGSINKWGGVKFAFDKARKVARLQALLDAAGWTYAVYPGTNPKRPQQQIARVTRNSSLDRITALLGKGKAKSYGEWLLRLPVDTRQAMLEEMRHWDGASTYDGPATLLTTACDTTAHWIAEMAVCSGWSLGACVRGPNVRGYSSGDSTLNRLSLRPTQSVKTLYPPEEMAFDGTVYCVSVPTGAFLVRRDGATWVTGNCAFDGSIIAGKFGIRPKLWLDTVQFSNAHVKPFTRRSSLDATHRYLAKLFPDRNPPPFKGNVTMSFKGIQDLPPHMLNVVGDYCVNDNLLTQWCAEQMLPWFTAAELLVMHQTTQAYLNPKLRIDTDMLMEHVRNERARKDALLARLGIEKTQLMSNNQFALLLESRGVVAPTKVSPTTGNVTYAFAKTDLGFLALQHHPDPDVALLVQIRLGVKSTIEETRAQRLLGIVESDTDPLPVPLHYSGAATHRHSGAGGINLQNLGRTSPIRKAIMAPPGHSLVVCDASQIECVSGDTLVLTRDRGYIPIIDISNRDLLWDGVDWVSHGGVVLKGYKEVITYGGITGTPDHIVYCADGTPLQLAVAAQRGAALAVGERGGQAIRFVAGAGRGNPAGSEARTPVGAMRLRDDEAGAAQRPARGQVQGLPGLHAPQDEPLLRDPAAPHREGAGRALQPHHVSDEPERVQPGLCRVSGAGDSEPVSVLRGVHSMGGGEPAAPDLHRGGVRPHRQQRALCAGKPAAGDARGERAEPHGERHGGVVRGDNERAPLSPLGGADVPPEHGAERAGAGGDSRPNLVAVYDIINAGPRRRFTANGVIISNCRVMVWLAKEPLAIETFRAGKDLYSEVGTVMFGTPVSKKETPRLRQLSKVACLACQFALSGGGYYQHVTLAGEKITRLEAFDVVDKWRAANPRIVKLWSKFTSIIEHMCSQKPDTEHVFQMLRFGYDAKRNAVYITMPTGLRIWYPNVHYAEYKGREGWAFKADKDEKPTFLSRNLLANNCLAAGTEVLTDAGWKPIETVTLSDRLWDGVEWVKHDGLIHQGHKRTITLNGVQMTPDHKVLTTKGWRRAENCADHTPASFDGPPSRTPRLQPSAHGDGRAEGAPSVGMLVQHAPAVSAPDAPRLPQLRGARDSRVPALGDVRELPRGYGADVAGRAMARPHRQHGGLHAGELPLGHAEGTGAEPAQGVAGGHGGPSQSHGDFVLDAALSVEPQAVYDLANAGRRTRFVVRGDGGEFVVHNCVQALARSITIGFHAPMLQRKYNLRWSLTVHDELVFVVPDHLAARVAALAQKVMRQPPSWFPDLVLDAEVSVAKRYGDAK